MASSERATSRSLAVPLSTEGRLVVSARDGSTWAFCSDCRSPSTLAATMLSWSAGMLAVSGRASQLPVLTERGPAKAAACTVSGP